MLTGCQGPVVRPRQSRSADRLSFRAGQPAPTTRRTGTFAVQGSSGSDPALVRVPERTPSRGLTCVVVLHGAGGEPGRSLDLLEPYADERELVLVAPKSEAATWDVLVGGYGPDVANIDRLLARLARSCPISRYAVGGFSDGASYALSLGIANGDVFERVLAFSPGFEAAEAAHGRPRFFVSHGTADQVLPVERCSRRIVPNLEDRGYDVRYEEFEGGHHVPSELREQAARWVAEG